jgi:Fibrinogen beta and gamma chains, C-terminal globular domain
MKVRPWLAIFGVGLSGACVDSRVVFGDDYVGGAAATTSGSGGREPAVGASAAIGAGGTSGRAGEPGNAGGIRPGAGGEGGAADADSGGGGEPSSGAGGSEVETSCADTCRNGTCTTAGAMVVCQCHSGFVSEGASCRRPRSCAELHRAEPSLANGAYSLQPSAAKAEFQSYCLMTGNGGGWTLVLNQGTEFDPSGMGSGSELAYAAKGTNLAYSSVALESDVMLDVRMDAIASENYTARAVISAVQSATRGRTVRELFTSGPYYLDAEDNGNLSLTSSIQCNFSPADLGPLFCQSPVLVLGKQETSCSPSALRFAISGAASYTEPWHTCAGWPQATVADGQQRFPNSFRVWIR